MHKYNIYFVINMNEKKISLSLVSSATNNNRWRFIVIIGP